MITKALRFLTTNSIFLAFNASLVVFFANYLYGDQSSFPIYLAAFLSTLGVYGINKVSDLKEDSINRPDCKAKGSLYIVLSISVLLVSLGIGIFSGVSTLLIILAPLAIGFIYSFQIAKSVPRLKEITGIKSIVVALSWAITGAFLPAMQSTSDSKIILVFLFIFAQTLVNTIIFDAVDIRGDHFSGVKTIPIALGRVKTRKLLFIVNSSLIIWLMYCLVEGVFLSFIPAILFGVIYGYVMIWAFLRENASRFHAELLVDGEWVPIVFLARVLILR